MRASEGSLVPPATDPLPLPASPLPLPLLLPLDRASLVEVVAAVPAGVLVTVVGAAVVVDSSVVVTEVADVAGAWVDDGAVEAVVAEGPAPTVDEPLLLSTVSAPITPTTRSTASRPANRRIVV